MTDKPDLRLVHSEPQLPRPAKPKTERVLVRHSLWPKLTMWVERPVENK